MSSPKRQFAELVRRGQIVAPGVLAVVLVALNISPLLMAVLVGTGAAGIRTVRLGRLRRAADRRRSLVLTCCEGLAADLAAGTSPHHALRALAEEWPELGPVADAASIGSDVPTAFRAVSELPGAAMLRVPAAAWAVAHRSGAGLANTIALAAETVRAQRATARLVRTELAAAHATARLLGLLPLGILVLGRGMGGDPFGFLVRSTPGQLCLALGLGLVWTGTFWLERIAEQVEQSC